MDKSDLGDRMKLYEGNEAGRRFMPLVPVVARLDGKCFSVFTKGMKRPYDTDMSALMIRVTQYLVEKTNACVGYTQSDEISLVWYSDNTNSQIFFDGRIQKMASVLAAMTSVFFNAQLPGFFPDKVDAMPVFDCRVWTVPTRMEACNTLLWRERDATKNSISMAARSVYSHKELMNKNGTEMQEMLFQKGVNWNDYPSYFKRGTFVQRCKVVRKFTADEIAKLPQKHEARMNLDLEVERSVVKMIEMPPFNKVTNRVGVVFEGEKPLVERELCSV